MIRRAEIHFNDDSTSEQRDDAVAEFLRLVADAEHDAVDYVVVDSADARDDVIADRDALDQLAAFAFPTGEINPEEGPDPVQVSEHVTRTLAATGRLPGVDPSDWILPLSP